MWNGAQCEEQRAFGPHLRVGWPTRHCAGFALLALLVVVALMGAALASVALVWHTQAVRDKEQELLFVGQEFRKAIASYLSSSPGGQQYPKRLEDLLVDPRFPSIKRHLRRIYTDPFTGEAKWGLVLSGDAILGVYSLAVGAPIKHARFPAGLEAFADARSYADWKFIPIGPAAPAGNQAGGAALAPVPGSSTTPAPVVIQSPDPPPPPPSPVQAQRRQGLCNRQLVADKKMCQEYVATQGQQAISVCLASADLRYTSCANDEGVLPPLDTTGGG
jgi:type II secretory pathway pseudopilin PulG